MEVEVPVMAPSEEIVAVHEAPPAPAPMASAGAALPDKALDTSPSPSPPPTTPTPPAAAAPLFRKGQSVWYASTPKTSHDALVLEDAAAGAATVRIRFMTNRFVEDVPVARVSDITAGRSDRKASAKGKRRSTGTQTRRGAVCSASHLGVAHFFRGLDLRFIAFLPLAVLPELEHENA